jgi:hypothetical protein
MENPNYPAWQPELARFGGSTETGDTLSGFPDVLSRYVAAQTTA